MNELTRADLQAIRGNAMRREYSGTIATGDGHVIALLDEVERLLAERAAPGAATLEEIARWQLDERKRSLDDSQHESVRWLASGKDVAYSRVLDFLAAAQPPAGLSVEQVRSNFEVWWWSRHPDYTSELLKRTSKSGAYDSSWVNGMWLAWNAALSAQQKGGATVSTTKPFTSGREQDSGEHGAESKPTSAEAPAPSDSERELAASAPPAPASIGNWQPFVLAAIMDSLISQKAPDSVSGYRIMDAVIEAVSTLTKRGDGGIFVIPATSDKTLCTGDVMQAAPSDSERAEWPECEEFYELMQTYRHESFMNVLAVRQNYEAVKNWLRRELADAVREALEQEWNRKAEVLDALEAARKFVRGRHSTLTYGPSGLLEQIDRAIRSLKASGQAEDLGASGEHEERKDG